MNYEEKIALLDSDDFIALFNAFKAEPRWVTSAGRRSIQILGHCHGGGSHSAVFDPNTLIVNCFSLCGGGMLLHTWVQKAAKYDTGQEAKDRIEDWIDSRNIDFSDRVPRNAVDFEYRERPFVYVPNSITPVDPMPKEAVAEIYGELDNSLDTLRRITWCTKDGINAEILKMFDVAYSPKDGNIILPHHNINGDIVGLYERNFRPIRREVKLKYKDIAYKDLVKFPRAKYVPMLRAEQYRTEEKTSWSFPNSYNLYGLHLAKPTLKGKSVVVFEGGKSVMLSRQYGIKNAVATHTFGIHLNHISMLLDCGVTEIVLAFDKQYKDEWGQEWDLYERKTRTIAEKVKDVIKVTRITDYNDLLEYKDSPIDRGKEVFLDLLERREDMMEKKDSMGGVELDYPEEVYNINGY